LVVTMSGEPGPPDAGWFFSFWAKLCVVRSKAAASAAAILVVVFKGVSSSFVDPPSLGRCGPRIPPPRAFRQTKEKAAPAGAASSFA
jgi:hypothetical protein